MLAYSSYQSAVSDIYQLTTQTCSSIVSHIVAWVYDERRGVIHVSDSSESSHLQPFHSSVLHYSLTSSRGLKEQVHSAAM